jgi:hypothetical protein
MGEAWRKRRGKSNCDGERGIRPPLRPNQDLTGYDAVTPLTAHDFGRNNRIHALDHGIGQ